MSDNVVSLAQARRPVEVEAQECAEALKQHVDSGNAVAVAYVVVNSDGSVSTNFVHGDMQMMHLMALLGGAHHLAARLERKIDVT